MQLENLTKYILVADVSIIMMSGWPSRMMCFQKSIGIQASCFPSKGVKGGDEWGNKYANKRKQELS